jgi:MFS family permease
MSLGSIKVVITLLALSLGANLLNIGILIAANAAVTILFSLFWGRISDFFGLRKRFLLLFFLASSPMFVLLGTANSVVSLTVLYTMLAVFTSGIQPIAVMYSVEYREGKNWQKEIVKYNQYFNIGVILGLILYSLLALTIPLNWILYLSAIFCLISAAVLWKTAKEPQLSLEREAFAIINVQNEERTLTWSILDYFDIRKIRIPKSFKNIKPIHILFITCLVHWTGVFSFAVGEVPLMSAIGLSSSVILGISVAENAATIFSYSRLVPKVTMEYQKLVSSMIATRSLIIVAWAGLTYFIIFPFTGGFVFPLVFAVLFLTCYALLWYPIMCFAISQAEPNRKGTTQGQLLATVSLANVAGALIGGLLIAMFGYAVGFITSAVIAALAIPILRYVDIEIK